MKRVVKDDFKLRPTNSGKTKTKIAEKTHYSIPNKIKFDVHQTPNQNGRVCGGLGRITFCARTLRKLKPSDFLCLQTRFHRLVTRHDILSVNNTKLRLF